TGVGAGGAATRNCLICGMLVSSDCPVLGHSRERIVAAMEAAGWGSIGAAIYASVGRRPLGQCGRPNNKGPAWRRARAAHLPSRAASGDPAFAGPLPPG